MITPVQNRILENLSNTLFLKETSVNSVYANAEANWFITEASAQAVLPLAVPDTVPIARTPISIILAKNLNVIYEHIELHELLTSNNIPYVILKGCASAFYYDDPVLRTMGDVDFLVNPQDVSRAGELLESIGFTHGVDRGGIHIAYYRDASTWELHRSVNGIPGGVCGDYVKSCLSDIIDTAVDYETVCGTIRIPDPFHHCLILLLHTASHLTSEGVGLRHLCDWAVFANKVNVEQWKTELQNCGLYHFAQILTLVSVKYLGLSEQSWAGTADEALLEGLISDILAGGNFGQKDSDRRGQIKYISNRGERTVDSKNAVFQLWDTIGKKAEADQKSIIGVVAEYIGLVVSGKRKLDTGKTITAAEKRKKLYNQFDLFHTEPFMAPKSGLLKIVYEWITVLFYRVCCLAWSITSKRESKESRQNVIDNVTFIYKSFERQSMAKRLYYSIQKYYPGVRVIIADDSELPLDFEGPQIIQLPFNSGLSKGIQAALDRVQTKYTIRMDDDTLITPKTGWGKELEFLQNHPEVDLAAVNQRSPKLRKPRKLAENYYGFSMKDARKPLIIPHKTRLDDSHIVLGKTPNNFIIETKKYKSIGYDEKIRMIDHHEFFFRAAGNLVSCLNEDAFVFHYHNRFDPHYNFYRSDWKRDAEYIRRKYGK